MKTSKELLISCLLVSFCTLTFAQTAQTLSAPLGLTFGMNAISAKKILTSRGGKIETESPTLLLVSNVQVGNKTSDVAAFKFINNKLFEVSLSFWPEPEATSQKIYDELQQIVESKYGKGDYYRSFKGIYDDGDGFEMQAVKQGQATIVSYWTNFLNESGISLEIQLLQKNIVVRLGYQDGLLVNDAIAKQNEKNISDF
jgi:hypothetical protein